MKLAEPVTTEDFRRYYELRWRILRAPWNQPRGSERDDQDAAGMHLMVTTDSGTVIGVGRLHFISISTAQIRYMAVDITWQRKGAGTLLLKALEDRAVELGTTRVVVDARENALRFYRKQGYVTDGPGHVLYNRIPHVKMSKHFMQTG